MDKNNIYAAVEKYIAECCEEEMPTQMTKIEKEAYLPVTGYMLKRVCQIMLSALLSQHSGDNRGVGEHMYKEKVAMQLDWIKMSNPHSCKELIEFVERELTSVNQK